MTTCTNEVTRFPLSPDWAGRKHWLVNMPADSNGKRRPHGCLLQPGAVVWHSVSSVDGSIRSNFARNCGCNNGTPSSENRASNPSSEGDNAWRVVGLGWYTPENASGASKGLLKRVRNPLLSIRAKAGLTVFHSARNADSKEGPSERQCSYDGSLV